MFALLIIPLLVSSCNIHEEVNNNHEKNGHKYDGSAKVIA
jgi:hypothetical protein